MRIHSERYSVDARHVCFYANAYIYANMCTHEHTYTYIHAHTQRQFLPNPSTMWHV